MGLIAVDHDAPGFWQLLGPFFASRSLRRELGYPLWSDATFRWLVDVDGDRVVAWMGLRLAPEMVIVEWAWVHPEYRRRGCYRRLEAQLFDTPWLQERFRTQGFVETRRRGRWIYFEGWAPCR